MARNNQRGRNNNNPEGHNQHDRGWMESARERPVAAATVAAAAVGAGVFLWSRRNQISEQLSQLSDQIGEWSSQSSSAMQERQLESVSGGSDFAGNASGSSQPTATSSRRGGRSGSSGMSETGGGNASLGAQSGGSGMSASNSGRTGS